MKLKDIALQTNTSISTVSKVLNNKLPHAASEEVRKLIWDTALKEGYLPPSAIQNDNTPEQIIHILIAGNDTITLDDPFYTNIINGANEIAKKMKFSLDTTFYLDDFRDNISNLLKSPNLIFIGYCDYQETQDVFDLFDNIVHVSLNDINSPYDQVYSSGYKSTEYVLDYLHDLGHKKINFIGCDYESRHTAYKESIKRYGLDYDTNLVVTGRDLTMYGGELLMDNLIEEGNCGTAVFCMSDRIAIGAMKSCINHNLKVPQDISIIGMNDIEIANFSNPPLTTVHFPMMELGRIATTTLIDRINGNHTVPIKISVPWEFIERNSCAIAPK